MAYLRIFDEHNGAAEVHLENPRVVFGREHDFVDRVLAHKDVSRVHAAILRSGDGYQIVDLYSRAGTYVNDVKLEARADLHHGDGIRLGSVVMEFRLDDEASFNALRQESQDEIERHLLANYRLLPAGVNLRYRTIGLDPAEVFEEGDTVHIGEGGVVIPDAAHLEDGACLEVLFIWPNGKKKTLMGEVMGTIDGAIQRALCVKLHNVPAAKREKLYKHASRSEWHAVKQSDKSERRRR